jgi:predicted  nucleic acid-binding Zn-ribbon protein
MQDIRRGDRVITCDGCGRILVQPPGDPVSPA